MEEKIIYIAGLGLIGGSIALGIKRDHPNYKILGYNRSDKSREIALERGIVDQATNNFKEFAPLADVIILAVPIKQTIDFMKILADLDLKDDVIITDAGSTKMKIVEAAEKYLSSKKIQFVGSHPMAGSHKTGAIAADVNLFENAYYIFTPSTSLERFSTVSISFPTSLSILKPTNGYLLLEGCISSRVIFSSNFFLLVACLDLEALAENLFIKA